MSVEGRFFNWTMSAGEDLDDLTPGSGDLFKAIALDDGKPAANGKEAGGILIYGGKSGEHISIGISGVMKFVAAGAVVAGARLTVTTSGYFTTAVSGSYVVGSNLDTAVASGAVGTGMFNFAGRSYFGVQSGGTLP
ncbi:MAG: hypothetical protein V3S29_02020 [bacterium]